MPARFCRFGADFCGRRACQVLDFNGLTGKGAQRPVMGPPLIGTPPESIMRIFVHDYPGHAFPMQLSREFARLGHTVVHAFAAALEAPRGAVEVRADDPPGLTILPIVTGAGMDKYAFVRRVLDERAYGAMLAKAVTDAAPDLFITCTTPNDVLDVLRERLPRSLRILWWLQDIYTVGIK